MLAYNEFEYKKTKDYCKLDDRFQKNGQFLVVSTVEIEDKKTAYNKGSLYKKRTYPTQKSRLEY